jgi:hypothetical protein|tara:strand:- start:471 stop:662 length:192 start_codon:yes stop_codon:yes gene_type:complete
MENDFKKIKLNALYQKQESDELRNKWKNLTDQDPIEKDLALGEYIKSKTKYLKLLAQIKEHQQ